MASTRPSQDLETYNVDTGLQSPPSSIPVPTSPDRRIHRKPKKPPPITPRSFTRFFTPRSSLHTRSGVRTSRQALEEITSSALNASRKSSDKGQSLFGEALVRDGPSEPAGEVHSSPADRKRKLSMSSISTFSQQSTPHRRVRISLPNLTENNIDIFEEGPVSSPIRPPTFRPDPVPIEPPKPLRPIRRSNILTKAGGIMLRSVSGQERNTSWRGDWMTGELSP